MPRIRPPQDPVTIQLDGEPVVAARGEPVAAALIAAGHLALARSPKFHRPRGPSCLRGACDGCLARVDDVPNTMTCRIPAAEGMRIETQNVVGSRDTDLLRVADWFFPDGMNHHELFAGVPGVQGVMQAFARRVAGLGRLPGVQAPVATAAARRAVDVLVVGAGPAGMAAAAELAGRGRQVEVLDDDLERGGSARLLARLPEAANASVGDATDGPGALNVRRAWELSLTTFDEAVAKGRVSFRPRTTAAAIYGDEVLVVSDEREGGTEVVTARTVVLAPGAHDGNLAFEGNDTPGVMSARAACRLLGLGVTPGRRIVIAEVDGSGPFAAACAAALPDATRIAGAPLRVRGGSRVKAVTMITPAGERELACDALIMDTARSPAYELCVQAGAEVSRLEAGFLARTAPGGKVREGVFLVGEVVGTPLDPAAMNAAARELSSLVD
jgi:sarcosine oxidase subunit alpha